MCSISAVQSSALSSLLIHPYLKPSEVVYIEKNTFRIAFHNFDWRLNDLSNRPPDGF